MQATEVADLCLLQSGARGISQHARDVALVALMLIPNGAISQREYRKRVRETYLMAKPEHGSFFILFVLPVLISLISNWIAKWILNRTDLKKIRAQAFDAFIDSQQSMTDTRTSIPTPKKKETGP
jgi:uncharacterized membrane protein (DUF106 family)